VISHELRYASFALRILRYYLTKLICATTATSCMHAHPLDAVEALLKNVPDARCDVLLLPLA
jgi:hypothetical protein